MAKPSWLEKLVMGATKHIKEKYHSPAGREHLKAEKKRKEDEKKKKKEEEKASGYYGGAKQKPKTADELLREIKAGK